MPRVSYGPEAKKRSLHLFAALLNYANDELDCDEVALDAVRSHIQIHWQTEQRLVVRTKLRFLETLTQLAKTPLSGDQIKEALRRFEDYLAILDDNRPNRGGSEVWHFTLNLWHGRNQTLHVDGGDRSANLHRFEQEWEHRRPQKSKPETGSATHLAPAIPSTQEQTPHDSGSLADDPLPLPDDPWWHWCQESLEAQHYQRLTTNPLTLTNGVAFDLHELYLPLGLLERREQNRHGQHRQGIDPVADQGSAFEDADDIEADCSVSLEEFLSRLQSAGQHRIAIVGEPGAGKTTLLQKIATWLLGQQALPIWISLADLQGASLETYLLQDWLKQATRQIRVTPELQDAFADQCRQGRVWLLLDAVDEMAIDAATALSTLARQLRGWIADAHVVLTCRSNVWDSGKNAIASFRTYCNLSFSSSDRHDHRTPDDQVGLFIDRWFQDRPELSQHLRQELSQPKRKRIRDAVKNPLRLALLCRSWSLTQGTLPSTKTLLYQQFVETMYDWKQDRFPTAIAQRQQLNRALGQVALRALRQPEIRFRIPHTFSQAAFGEGLEWMTLALQLGWLNQVGISCTTGEKVYAFYHPTFQEYFAAQAISDWQFFLDPAHDFPLFSPLWREVILLWLGRTDVTSTDKEALIAALTQFEDGCGGFYSHRAYFLAAAGLAEFPQCRQSQAILRQLLEWRLGAYPTPVSEGARAAFAQADRPCAIAVLEAFIASAENPFARWQAAYTLGKTIDPGNAMAIAALIQLIHTLHNETLRLQVVESLGRIVPDHALVIRSLEQIMTSTQAEGIRRRAAYSLGKLQPGHPDAIATLEHLIATTSHATLRLRTAEHLLVLDPNNATATALLESLPQKLAKTSQRHLKKSTQPQDLERWIASLEYRLATASDAVNQRRLAYRLGTLQPGHPQAIAQLLTLLVSPESAPLYKRVVEDLKEVLLDSQLPQVVSRVNPWLLDLACDPSLNQSVQAQECYKLLWYCAQRLPYQTFLIASQNGTV